MVGEYTTRDLFWKTGFSRGKSAAPLRSAHLSGRSSSPICFRTPPLRRESSMRKNTGTWVLNLEVSEVRRFPWMVDDLGDGESETPLELRVTGIE